MPFEAAGYSVDIFTVTYPTPFDTLLRAKLGTWLRVYQLLDRRQSLSAYRQEVVSMYANLVALSRYASDRRQWYRVLVMTRHDYFWLPSTGVVSTLLASGNLDSAIFVQRKPGKKWEHCPAIAGENEDGWAATDFVHIISGRFIGCFMEWL